MYILIQVARHKCDNCLFCERVVYILIICMDNSSFLTDCESDNTDTEGTHSIAWRHVSGIHTHRSMKWCFNALGQHVYKCGMRSITGISGNVSY